MNCQINTHEIRLTLDWSDYNKINLIRCCYKPNEIIKQYTIDDVINSENFVDEIKNLACQRMSNHDYKIYDYCKTNDKICDWYNDEIDTITISTSTRCNLNCIMCNYKEKYNTNDKFVYFTLLNKIKNNHLKTIELTFEGEPFYYKEDTFNYIRSLTINDCQCLYIISNLTMLSENDIIELNNISNLTNVKILFSVSIDGITEETYKKIRKNNLFNKVINNTVLLKNYNMLDKINFVVQEENLHELDMVFDFWKTYNINKDFLNILLINGVSQNRINTVLQSAEWNNYINKLC